MATTAELYDKDFVRWTEEQARALRSAGRAGRLPLDWENLAEEVESLGSSTRRELASRIGLIIEHLFKIEHSPANDPRRGWLETVLRERAEIEVLLAENPSLRREIPGAIADQLRRRKKLIVSILSHYDEADPTVRAAIVATEYGADQVVGDWLPEHAVRRD